MAQDPVKTELLPLERLAELARLKNWSPRTLTAYAAVWRRLIVYAETSNLDLAVLTEEQGRGFFRAYYPEVGPSTLTQVHAAIRAYYSDQRLTNPFEAIPRPRMTGDREIRYLGRGDILRLLSELEKHKGTYGGACTYVLAYLLFATAQRFGSLQLLTWDDVLGNPPKIIRTLGKGRKYRDVPLNQGAGELLAWWKQLQAAWKGALRLDGKNALALCRSPYVFASSWGKPLSNQPFNKRIKSACKEASLTLISAHGFRHSAASALLERRRSLIEVKELLNHRNIATTAIYSHIDASSRQAAVDDLSLE